MHLFLNQHPFQRSQLWDPTAQPGPPLGLFLGLHVANMPQQLPEESCSVGGIVCLLIRRHRPSLLAVISMVHLGILA